jgi:TRAP-type uncharacterized transport system fused permease subunit
MAVIGMFAFSNATQGYFITKVNIIERLGFLIIVPMMLVPNIMQKWFYLPHEYVAYVIGIFVYFMLYFVQKAKIRKNY